MLFERHNGGCSTLSISATISHFEIVHFSGYWVEILFLMGFISIGSDNLFTFPILYSMKLRNITEIQTLFKWYKKVKLNLLGI